MPRTFGPVLLFRGLAGGRLRLAALAGHTAAATPPELLTAEGPARRTELLRQDDFRVMRFDFDLPAGGTPAYVFDGREVPVETRLDGDLRLVFASCNGQEHGDFDRPEPERNAMWARLAAEHARAPFALLLHGGDQIYADEDVKCHPLTAGWPDRLPREVTADQLFDIERALRRAFLDRYTRLLAAPTFAEVARQMPSLAM